MLALRNLSLLTPHTRLDNTTLLIDGDRIAAIGGPAQSESHVLDAAGLTAVPGFIDLQLNGGFGFDFTLDPASIWEVAARLPAHGVTAFLPTIITSPLERARQAQSVLRAGPPAGFNGARTLGLHLEGPFLNPAKRGAHNPNYLRSPDPKLVSDWSRDNGVLLVTLAPELDQPNLATVKCLRENGVVVSAGHSMATYDEALDAFEAGITYGTHLFNAMPALDHRAPGLAAALLADPRPAVGLIPDGIHVHPALVKLIWQLKGPRGVNVVTDAMAALGMPPGCYQLGDYEAIVDERSARLPDGRLAGSVLSLDQAVRNLIDFTGCTLAEAVGAVTVVPAEVLGLPDRGRLAPGCLADIVLLTPDLQVALTIAGGEVVHSAESAPLPVLP